MIDPLFAWFGAPQELLIVAVVALLLFGNRLPQVMRSLGQSVTEFKKGIDSIGEPLNDVKSISRDIDRELRK